MKTFPQLLSPYLKERIQADNSDVHRVLSLQYLEDPGESQGGSGENDRHYHADLMPGVERFYRRTLVVEPVLACAAHCRYCLRKNYAPIAEDMDAVAKFVAGEPELREILVTGGDPFLVPRKLDALFTSLAIHAGHIETVRVATRLPIHDPRRVTPRLLDILAAKYPFRMEVATQINHRAELFPEVTKAYESLLCRGLTVYNQAVLLKGVNDSLNSLIDVYDACRRLGIESHYLFHCVPISGLDHFRTTLDHSLDLVRRLLHSGSLSGRAKPAFNLMTDVGKVALLEGVILKRQEDRVLLQTHYNYRDRLKWNPRWVLPDSARVDEEGNLRVYYQIT